MNKFLKSIAVSLMLFLGVGVPAISISGCAAPKERIAFNATSATITSVNIAMKEWWTYVVKEEDRIASLAPMDRGTQSADLLRKEGKVMNAYATYQTAIKASAVAVRVAKTEGSPLPADVQAAILEVLTLVRDLKK
jgi:hypothetical protein